MQAPMLPAMAMATAGGGRMAGGGAGAGAGVKLGVPSPAGAGGYAGAQMVKHEGKDNPSPPASEGKGKGGEPVKSEPVKGESSASSEQVASKGGSKLRRETMKAPSSGKDIEVVAEGNAVVPPSKVTTWIRGKAIKFTDAMREEAKALRAKKQTARKEFDADPANAKRLRELGDLERNYNRSKAMASNLEEAGIPDTPAVNDEIIKQLLDVGQSVTSENRVGVRTVLQGEHGRVLAETTWTILPDGRAYLATLILKPIQ
jgi:hypothetical protein